MAREVYNRKSVTRVWGSCRFYVVDVRCLTYFPNELPGRQAFVPGTNLQITARRLIWPSHGLPIGLCRDWM